MRIVLASTSKNRQQLMDLAQIPYRVIPPKLDESTIFAQTIEARIEKLALAKAEAVRKKVNNAIIIAADTMGLFQDEVLEKPKYKMTAFERLQKLSGSEHLIYSGWAVLNTYKNTSHSGVVKTTVTFSNISNEELERYVNDNPVIEWAAGYQPVNSWAIRFVKRVEGSLTGFTHGLPLEAIIPALKQEGVEL